MGSKLTSTGVTFGDNTTEQQLPVNSVNGATANSAGEITVDTGVTSVNGQTGAVTVSANASDVIETIYLDTSLARFVDGNDPRSYGETGASVTHQIAAFTGFKTNSTYNTKHKLAFYSGNGYAEILIADLIAIVPTYSNPLYIQLDNDSADQERIIYFDGNNLRIISRKAGGATIGNHRYAFYRIDVHDFATNTLNVYEKTETYSKSEVNSLISNSGGGGFTNRKVVTSSTTWTVPTGISRIKISITGPGMIGGAYNGGTAGGTASAIYDVTGGTTQLTIALANYGGSNSRVTFSDRTGYLEGGSGKDGGAASITATTNLLTDSSLLITGGLPADLQSGNNSITGGASIYGTGPAYGGGGGASRGASGVGAAVVVLEY